MQGSLVVTIKGQNCCASCHRPGGSTPVTGKSRIAESASLFRPRRRRAKPRSARANQFRGSFCKRILASRSAASAAPSDAEQQSQINILITGCCVIAPELSDFRCDSLGLGCMPGLPKQGAAGQHRLRVFRGNLESSGIRGIGDIIGSVSLGITSDGQQFLRCICRLQSTLPLVPCGRC